MIAFLWTKNLGQVATFPINATKYQRASNTSNFQQTPTTLFNCYYTIALSHPLFILLELSSQI